MSNFFGDFGVVWFIHVLTLLICSVVGFWFVRVLEGGFDFAFEVMIFDDVELFKG